MISAEEYFQIDENSYDARYEYIDGHVRKLTDSTLIHSRICVHVTAILHTLLINTTCSVYNLTGRVRLSETRYVYPDVTVACDEQRGNSNMLLYPRLVVEVLSPSTEAYDRGEKFTYYRECATIREYLLINTQRPFIEMFRREANNFWTYHAFESNDEVELVSLEIHFPVMQVYRKVILPDTHVRRDE